MTLIVNGEKIEDSAIQQEVERLRPDYERVFANQDSEEREAQLLDWSRENVIEMVLINQEAQKDSYRVPTTEIEAAFAELKKQYKPQRSLEETDDENDQEIKKDVELELRIEHMFREVYKDVPKPSKDVVLKYYQENKERFKSDERVRIAHIVKYVNWQTDEATAENLIVKAQDELKNGAVFEKLVAKYSDCPENGGDLGYIIRGQMVEEFEDMVFNLGVNDVSDIFRTRFGYHIAKVYDRKPAVLQSFEQVHDQVLEALKNQMRTEAVHEFIDKLKSKAKIEEI